VRRLAVANGPNIFQMLLVYLFIYYVQCRPGWTWTWHSTGRRSWVPLTTTPATEDTTRRPTTAIPRPLAPHSDAGVTRRHTDGGYYSSWKAVDGNNNTLALIVDNSCIWTSYQNYPWWAVDLGAAVAVLGVLLTSRAFSRLHTKHCVSLRWSILCRVDVDQLTTSRAENWGNLSVCSPYVAFFARRAVSRLCCEHDVRLSVCL